MRAKDADRPPQATLRSAVGQAQNLEPCATAQFPGPWQAPGQGCPLSFKERCPSRASPALRAHGGSGQALPAPSLSALPAQDSQLPCPPGWDPSPVTQEAGPAGHIPSLGHPALCLLVEGVVWPKEPDVLAGV